MVNNTYEYCLEHGNDPSGRFGKAVEMLEKYTFEDPVEYMFSILQNVSQNSTMWSLVFDAKNRRLYYKTAFNREIRYVSLGDFDLSCNSGAYMLDMNGLGTGNMSGKFVPYTEELNSQLIRNTYRQLTPQFGHFIEEALIKIFNYPSSTKCMDK